MIPITSSLASLVALLPILVAAIPNPPEPTSEAHLDKRANGANTIGFSLSGTSCEYLPIMPPRLIVTTTATTTTTKHCQGIPAKRLQSSGSRR
jgi:hypothetical protein